MEWLSDVRVNPVWSVQLTTRPNLSVEDKNAVDSLGIDTEMLIGCHCVNAGGGVRKLSI
jgi:hypothetical protein